MNRASRIAISLVTVLTLLTLLSPGLAVEVATQEDNDVPMFRGNPARTGEMPGPGPDPKSFPVLYWSFETRGGVTSSPAVVDGVVYVGSDKVYAIDATSGQELWSFETDDHVTSSPAVVDGVVYVGSDDDNLYAIDAASGQELWSRETSGDVGSSPAVVDGVVYVGSFDTSIYGLHWLYAIDAASGQELWSFRTAAIFSSPAVVEGVVYVASHDGNLHAIDAASGQELWSFETGSGLSSPSTSAVVDGVVYVGSDDDNLHAIDAASGQELWSFETGGNVGSSPAVVDGVVYVGSDDDNVYAVNAATGQELWSFATSGEVESSPALVEGVVYVGSNDDNLYAIDAASGQELWSFATGGSVKSSPAVVDGVVYVGSGDGYVNAIGETTDEMFTATAEWSATETAGVNASATQEAIFASWDSYFQLINAELIQSADQIPGLRIDAPYTYPDSPLVPYSYRWGANYYAYLSGGTGTLWVTLEIFSSAAEAAGAMEDMSGGLRRSGWQDTDVDGLDHDHVCLTLVQTSWTEAVYMTIDETLIISYSSLGVEAPDAALLNAVDLARLMNDAYDAVEQPS